MHYYKKYKESGDIHHQWYYKEKIPWYIEVADLCVSRATGFTVLDVGCGDGLVSKLLLEAGHRVYGLDNNKKGLEIANKLSPKGIYMLSDLNTFSTDAKFDYMVCLNTIEHLEKPENIVKIFKDSITKGGIIITDKKIEGNAVKYHHNQEFNIKELKELFKDFICEEIELKTPSFIALEVSK